MDRNAPSLATRSARVWTRGRCALHLCRRWLRRWRMRRELQWLDDRQLHDVGLTRDAVDRERKKPFWR